MYVHIYHCWHLVLGEFKHVFKPILKPQVANRWFRTIVDSQPSAHKFEFLG